MDVQTGFPSGRPVFFIRLAWGAVGGEGLAPPEWSRAIPGGGGPDKPGPYQLNLLEDSWTKVENARFSKLENYPLQFWVILDKTCNILHSNGCRMWKTLWKLWITLCNT